MASRLLSTLLPSTATVGHAAQHNYITDGLRSIGFNVADYGALGDGTTDNTTAIQAAIDAAYAAGGGVAFLPAGTYLTGPLILKYGVSLVGSASEAYNESLTVGSVLKLQASSNAPLITTDQVNGSVRAASAVGPGNQLWQNSCIENLGLDGNRSNQTSIDADLIRLHQVWGMTIKNVYGINAKGFGLRALDCNALTIRNNSLVGAGVYLESLADSNVFGNNFGGGNGLIYPVVWLAGTGEFCWQNLFCENIIFNNSNNLPIVFPTATVVAATDVWTTSTDHGWVDGTPVIVTTTGTLPAGAVAGRTYYVDVLSATTFKLASTRANLAAGTYVDITDTGSGTHTVQTGENCNIYLSDPTYCKWNIFANNRVDQAYGHGIVCDGASDNIFSGNLINGAGLHNATGKHGIHLQNSALRNSVSGGSIDGTVYSSGGNNTNQVIGVYADSTSFGTRLDPATTIRGHTTNVQIVNYSGEVAHLSFGSHDFELIAGSPAIGLAGGSRRSIWLLDQSTQETVGTEFWTPVGWRTIRITLWWINAGAGSGDVAWSANIGAFAEAESLNAADASGTDTVISTAGAQDVLVKTVLTPDATIAEGKLIFVRVNRVAANVGDTLANDAGLVAVRIERVS